MNKIVVTACDNELYLIAYDWNNSYLLSNIKSGNGNKVDVVITVEQGDSYVQPAPLNGVESNLNKQYTVNLPSGDYTVLPICINWGGAMNVAGTINEMPFNAASTEICEGVKISVSGGGSSVPTEMTIASGNEQIIRANVYSPVSFAQPLVVCLKDKNENPVKGVPVQWSYVGHEGGRPQVALPKSSISDKNGNASVTGTVQLSALPSQNGGSNVDIEAKCGTLTQKFELIVTDSNG